MNTINKHGWTVADRALRRNHGYPDKPNEWVEFTFNDTYLALANEFPEDYRTLDGKSWVTQPVECDVCSHSWKAVHVEGSERLECPNCRQMAYINR